MSSNPFTDAELYRRVAGRLVGRTREVSAVLAALAAGKNVLLLGPPGTSKSTLLRAIAEESNMPFFLVEGSADLTPQKLVGTFNPAKVVEQGFKPEFFEPGPLVQAMVSGGILYIEEFNRVPEDAANVLIRAAEEGEISVPRLGVVRAKPLFRIVCAMNPYDDVGTSRVSRALLDRFVMLRMDYQSREEEIEIVKRKTASRLEWLVQLAVDLARATREHPAVRMGSSVRGAIDMVLVAEQLIRLKGAPTREDLRTAARMAFSPKIWLKDLTRSPESVIDELFDRIFGDETPGQEGEEGSQPKEGRKTGEAAELSKGPPQRVAFALLDNPSLIQAMKGLGVRGLEAIGRALPLLPKPLRDEARSIACELIVKLSQGYAGRRSLGRASRHDEMVDIDLEKTLENVLESRLKTPEQIAALAMRRRGAAYALLVDRSSSMGGFKLLLGAFIASVLAYSASRVHDYCVLAFNTQVEVLKHLRERKDPESVVTSILSLEAEGYTDIHKALEAARLELLSAGYEPRAILVTDAEWTAGENPLKAASMFRELNVVCVPSKWVGFAKAMAELGGGSFTFIRSIEEVPEKLWFLQH